MTGVELLREWYDRVWVKADLDAVDEMLDKDAMAQGLMPDLAAQIEDFKIIVPAILRMVRDVSFDIDQSMESGDKAWAQVIFRGKNADDMAPITITGQVMIRSANGKIIEAYNSFDFVGLFEQLGLLPQDTIALCLSGVELK